MPYTAGSRPRRVPVDPAATHVSASVARDRNQAHRTEGAAHRATVEVNDEREVADGDHHRVAGPDLEEHLRTSNHGTRTATMISPGTSAVRFDPSEIPAATTPAYPNATARIDVRVERREHRQRVARGRAGPEVAAERSHARIWGEPTVTAASTSGQRRARIRLLHLPIRETHAEDEVGAHAATTREFGDTRDVDDRGGAVGDRSSPRP